MWSGQFIYLPQHEGSCQAMMSPQAYMQKTCRYKTIQTSKQRGSKNLQGTKQRRIDHNHQPTNQPINQLNMMMTILVMLKVLMSAMSDVPTIQTTTWHIMNHRRAKDHALITYGCVLLGSWQCAHHTQPERCKVQILK